MKKLGLLILISLTVMACKEPKKELSNKVYASFGDKITANNHLSKQEMFTKFKSLKKGDTIQVKFASKINAVCKKKGCWMRLDLGKGEESLVRFKDYGFFMPLNADNREVIVKGKAYIDVVTVKELRHYAKDEGVSEDEIAKITEDEITYAVESNGVLMVK